MNCIKFKYHLCTCVHERIGVFSGLQLKYNITLNYALKNAILIIINTIELIY